MKNTFKLSFLIITIFIVCLSLVACSENGEVTTTPDGSTTTAPNTTTPITTVVKTIPTTTSTSPTLIIPEQYQALYFPGAMNGLSSSAGAYSGALSQGTKRYHKTDVTTKSLNLFGTNQEYSYKQTIKTAMYPYDVDTFETASVTIKINSQTGQIVGYENFNDDYQDKFKPIFDNKATKEDYLAYAKKVLSESVDIDFDQYQVEIEDYDSEYYFVKVSKTISGIPCRGYYTIGIEASGMVSSIDIFINEEGFAPFEKLVIDKEKLDQVVMAYYETDTTSLNVFSHESPEHYLYVEDGVLWSQSSIDFRYEGRTDSDGYKHEAVGSFCYMIKLAEVQTPSADKVTDR